MFSPSALYRTPARYSHFGAARQGSDRDPLAHRSIRRNSGDMGGPSRNGEAQRITRGGDDHPAQAKHPHRGARRAAQHRRIAHRMRSPVRRQGCPMDPTRLPHETPSTALSITGEPVCLAMPPRSTGLAVRLDEIVKQSFWRRWLVTLLRRDDIHVPTLRNQGRPRAGRRRRPRHRNQPLP